MRYLWLLLLIGGCGQQIDHNTMLEIKLGSALYEYCEAIEYRHPLCEVQLEQGFGR